MAERLAVDETRESTFAVLGLGNGGQALAGFLALRGFAVSVWNRSAEKLEAVSRLGGIHLGGEVRGFGAPRLVTDDVGEAVRGAHVIMVAVPASGHRDVASLIARHLEDGQIIVLNPGRTGGALAFARNLRAAGCTADVTVAEANTFVYASRTVGPGRSYIHGIKQAVTLAALPATRTMEAVRAVRSAFPQFVPAEDVLTTSLDNMGAIFHPVPALLNVTRIERGEEYEHYMCGISPGVASFLERLDHERVEIARALGVSARPAVEWLRETYGVSSSEGLFDAIQSTGAYRGIMAPNSLRTRYIYEDVPFSLVPMAHLGDLAGVSCPTIRLAVSLAEALTGEAFWETGRDAAEMGISGMSKEALTYFVRGGDSDA